MEDNSKEQAQELAKQFILRAMAQAVENENCQVKIEVIVNITKKSFPVAIPKEA